MKLAMIKAKVNETPKAIVNHFIYGLNSDLSCVTEMYSFLDIEVLVPQSCY